MSVAGYFKSNGLNINFYDIHDNAMAGDKAFNIRENLTSYSHEISAVGGFSSARIKFYISQDDVASWVEQGVGKWVVVKDRAQTVWEGFVDSININYGSLNISVGPLMDMGNRISVIYTPTFSEFNDKPAVTGTQTISPFVENKISQEKYGIIERLFSVGELNYRSDFPLTLPEQTLAYAYLQEYSKPKISTSISLGSNARPEIELSCKGTYEWLNNYIVFVTNENDTIPEDFDFLSKRIVYCLNQDPNGFISTDHSHIFKYDEIIATAYGVDIFNPLNFDINHRTAMELITEAMSMGFGYWQTAPPNAIFYQARFLFGIYEDRIPWFTIQPSEIEYYFYANRKEQIIQNVSGFEVSPWLIRPGKWLFIPDLISGSPMSPDIITQGMFGSTMPTPHLTLRSDPRTLFIESVTFNAPSVVEIKGGDTEHLTQIIARVTQTGSMY